MTRRAYLTVLLLLLVHPPGRCGVTGRDIQQRVGVVPGIGRQVPLQTLFRDEEGSPRTLGDVIAGTPAIVALVYFDCPNLCAMTLQGLSNSLKRIPWRPAIDYEVVAVSIDPREGPALAAAKRVGHPAWHFLTGEEANIRGVAQSLGYRYFWDAGQGQYAHPAGVVVLSGTGRIVQYLNGLEFPATELQRALSLARQERSGTVAERLWLLCFHYEALAGRYGHDITAALRILGLVTVAGLGFLLFRLIRRPG